MPAPLVLSAVGQTSAIAINPRSNRQAGQMPSIYTKVSGDWSGTYQIEVTNDTADSLGNFGPSTVWYPIGALTGLSTGGDWLFTGVATGIRANCTARSAGTLTFGFAQ